MGAFFACDINLKAGRNLFMRGEGEGADAHRAFEVAAEHVAKRLRRYRRRVNDHARSLAEERPGTETATQYVLQAEPEEETPGSETAEAETAALNGEHSLIIAEQPTFIARLTVSEAVMRLDLTQQPVLMFRNSGTGALAVVYRRPDGCVGWIDATAA